MKRDEGQEQKEEGEGRGMKNTLRERMTEEESACPNYPRE